MACAGSMRGEDRFRRQSQRDLVRDRTGAGAEGETGVTGVGPPSQVTQKPTELLREHMRAQCLQAVDEQAHGGPLHVIDLVSIPITVVPKVQYFCSYFTSRPFLFHKFHIFLLCQKFLEFYQQIPKILLVNIGYLVSLNLL